MYIKFRVFYKMKCRHVRNSLASNFESWASNFGTPTSPWASGQIL